MGTTQPTPQQRRSSRLQFHCRVKISAINAEGNIFSEETETVIVSKFGAAIRTTHEFTVGQILSVRTLEHDHVGQFQVVWTGQPDTPEANMIGVEWVDARRFWGIEFPPEDWGLD